MRDRLLLVCVLAISTAATAQSGLGSWANLNQLHPGQKIQVVDANGKKHSGTFMSVSDASLSIKDDAGDETLPKQDVRKVRRKGTNRRLRNTLLGTGIGAGIGAGVSAAIWEHHGFLAGKGTGAAVGAIIGALLGTIAAVGFPTHDTVYDARSH